MVDTPAACREEAQRARIEAQVTGNPEIGALLRRIAGEYEGLARFFEALEQDDAAASSGGED
jgi:hypothetical protein